jgi:CheY-like chemotaxis protein
MTASILVVDDEPDVAELFRQRFRREARDGTYAMHFAQSGESALEKLDHGIEPQLIVILSDINMPGMDGLALLHAIKQKWPAMPGDDGDGVWRRGAAAAGHRVRRGRVSDEACGLRSTEAAVTPVGSSIRITARPGVRPPVIEQREPAVARSERA